MRISAIGSSKRTLVVVDIGANIGAWVLRLAEQLRR